MKRSQADLLTHVEGDAPMGGLFRQYWLPVLHSERLVADGAPVKVRMLGQNYAAFRDTNGRVGLINELCPHRGVSMLLARNEDCGLRCIQHGWKVDASGKVVEAPNMPADAPLERIDTNARPVEERHGIVWAWFGDAEQAPPLTPYDFTTLPEGHVDSVMATGQCNWLQLLETLWDPFHVSILHGTSLKKASASGNAKSTYSTGLMELEYESTPYGFFYNSTSDGKTTGTPFAMPCYCYHMLGANTDDDYLALGHVPVDNEHMLMWAIVFNPFRPLSPTGAGRKLLDTFPKKYEYRDHISRENMWGQDRARMANGDSFSGLDTSPTGFAVFSEDLGTIESMGPIFDRTREHLAPTDKIVMRGRGRLLEILADLDKGVPAPGTGAELQGVLPFCNYFQLAE
jgi:phthalate 4,5-dioxygenase